MNRFKVFWTDGPAEPGVTPMQLTEVTAECPKEAEKLVEDIELVLNSADSVHVHRTEEIGS